MPIFVFLWHQLLQHGDDSEKGDGEGGGEFLKMNHDLNIIED